jgi:stage II sporulation protein D
MIRVGVAVAAEGPLQVRSATGLHILDALTNELLLTSAGPAELEVAREGEDVRVSRSSGPVVAEAVAVRFEPAGDKPITLDAIPYRGAMDVFAVEPEGLNAVNDLPLEDYLLGVVPIEIGPRGEDELAAVAAQAVAARTYAVAHLRAREEMGFDVFGSVEDQAYGGLAAERPESTRAVRETVGQILMYGGLPIRAMYHSTCGGRTSPVEEVLDRAPAPYLQSVSDRAPDGTDYCAASPRYRWVDTLRSPDLNGRVREQVERIFGTTASHTGDIVDLRVSRRTPSGRVEALAVRGTHSEFVLERLDIRIALQNEAGRILGSTDFEVVRASGGSIELHGRGFGHGSGMCQWGAIGRARAGQDWQTILATYYPGAKLVSVY